MLLLAAEGHIPKDRFTDFELGQMIDGLMLSDDLNDNGFIDYPEYVTSVRSRQ
jgi:hypothetical protein